MVGKKKVKSGGGGKLSRSEVVTIRLNPRLRYLTEIAARSQRRTVSSFIEWAIEQSLDNVELPAFRDHPEVPPSSTSVAKEARTLWNVHESIRFVDLAMRYPHLLTHPEQVLWQLIQDSGLMIDAVRELGPDEIFVDYPCLLDFVYPTLRKHWQLFNDIADGNEPESKLPKLWSPPIG